MSLPAISLGDWFSMSRKGETGEVGWYIHPKAENIIWLCVGLAEKIPQLDHCTNGPRKQSSHLMGPPCMQCSSAIYKLELFSIA